MSIGTYDELKTAVSNWLNRSDLTSYIPDFIALAEARVNRRLRLRAMQNRATQSVSTEYISLPTGFLGLRTLQLNTDPKRALLYVTPEQLDNDYNSGSGEPVVFTLIGDEIQLGPIPDGTYTVEIAYFKKFDTLSASTPTNWLITNAPDIYLYASLIEAEPFLKNDERIMTWANLLDRAIEDIQRTDRNELPDSALAVRVDRAY